MIHALENFNLPYTGATARFYNYKKEFMKMMVHVSGLLTPAHTFVYDLENVQEALNELNFPMIVKHYNGYNSIGMTQSSKVHDEAQLREQCNIMLNEFGGALVEEFIAGREFTVLVVENPQDKNKPIALLPLECVFFKDETIKHYDLKWAEYQNI